MMQRFYLPADAQIQVVGISGKKGSGKSTLTRKCVVPQGFVPLAFARHFKVDMVAKDGAPADEVFGLSEKKSEETRVAMQLRGTEQGRDVYGDEVWLRHIEAHIMDLWLHGITRFVILDVRFPNEVEYVQQALGGVVYRLEGRGGSPDEHRSEKLLDGYTGFNTVFDNSPANSERVQHLLRNQVVADFGAFNHYLID